MRHVAWCPIMRSAFAVAVATCHASLAWQLLACQRHACRPPSRLPRSPTAKVDQIIVVFKTHFDIGYTDMAKNVVERYRTTMIDQALEVCDRNRDLPAQQQFVWTLPGWPMSQIMSDWPGQTAERKSRIEQALERRPLRRARAAVHDAHGTVGARGSCARTRFRFAVSRVR